MQPEMYSNNSFTFKTRRKDGTSYIWLALFVICSTYPTVSLPIPCPENCGCFISQLDNLKSASCHQLTNNITIYPNIRLLKIIPRTPLQKCILPEDGAAKMFPNLLFLNLSNCSLGQVSANNFKHFKNILNIDLSYNEIAVLDRFTFTSNRLLRYVTLEGNTLLGLNHPPILESNSIDELNLASCNLDKVPLSMFKALPNLRHLTMSNNQLKTLKDNSLPDKLRTLDLSKNKIVNVPTDELNRLQLLTQINLSENPVNCTCALIGFQNWVSGKGVIFVSNIKCAYPTQYQGHKLINLPQYDLCDAKVVGEATSSECSGNQICSNGIFREDGYMGDQPKDESSEVFKQDEVIPVTNESLEGIIDDTMRNRGRGGGSDDSTAIPDIINSTIIPTGDSSLDTVGIIKMDYELSSMSTLEPIFSSVQSSNETAKTDDTSAPPSFIETAVNVELSPTTILQPDSNLAHSSSEAYKTNDTSTAASFSETAVNLEVTPTTILELDSSSVYASNETSKTENIFAPDSTGEIGVTLKVSPSTVVESSISSVQSSSEAAKTNDTSTLASFNETTVNLEVTPPTILEPDSSSVYATNETPKTENTCAPNFNCEINVTLGVSPTTAVESYSSSVLSTSETPNTEDTYAIAFSNEATTNYDVRSTNILEQFSSSVISFIASPGTENTSALAFSSGMAEVASETPFRSVLTSVGNYTDGLSHAKLQKSGRGIDILGYVVPGLAVFLVGLICIAVYCSQYASNVKTYKRPEASGNDEGSELQQVSLLPDKIQQPAIVKNKYLNEDSSQCERLMNDSDKSTLQEVNSNGSHHANATVDSCNKLSNGQSNNENGPLECTIAKVTTIPESVPKIPIIRNL